MIVQQIAIANKNICSISSSSLKQKSNNSFENFHVQSGLSLAQSNAIKNSFMLNNIAFKSRVIAPSFDIKDIKIIQNLLLKCQYGKKDLIYGDISHVKLQKNDSGVLIENFYTEDKPNGPITGICEELTYKLGKRLEKAFGDKYLFFALDGNNKEFSDGHTHLCAMKNTEKNKTILKKHAENNEQIKKIREDFFNSRLIKLYIFKSNELLKNNEPIAKLDQSKLGKHCIESFNKVEEKINNIKNNINIEDLKYSLMIDPSFNRIEEFGIGGKLFEGYAPKGIRTLNEVNAIPSNSRFIPQKNGIPLGYLKNLAPEICNNENKSYMLAITNIAGKIYPGVVFAPNITEKLNRNHPVIKFIEKLNQE